MMAPVGTRVAALALSCGLLSCAHGPGGASGEARGPLAWHIGSCDAASEDSSCIQEVPEGWLMLSPGRLPGPILGNEALSLGQDLWSHEAEHLLLVQDHETTQAEWTSAMARNPSYFRSCGGSCPVERVSFWDALTYLNKLSERDGLEPCYELHGCHGDLGSGCDTDRAFCEESHGCRRLRFHGMACTGYRLPTEREWGWIVAAVQANLQTAPGEIPAPWCGDVSGGTTRPVERSTSPAWPLDGLSGNVWEWVWDGTAPGLSHDPAYRYHRGGSFLTSPDVCTTAARSPASPTMRSYFVGLRPVRTIHLSRTPRPEAPIPPIPSRGAKLASTGDE